MPTESELVAMGAALIAQETGEDVTRIRVLGFREIVPDGLHKYLVEHRILYRKYRLGDEGR